MSFEQREGLLILIPKKNKDLLEVENWRPITLLNTDYKLITKTLSRRLQIVLDQIIDQEQNGFIKNRNIANATLSMSEIINFCFERNLSCGLLALDMRKAFDMLDRNYLLLTLKHMGFGECFINYIKCIFKENFTNITHQGLRSLNSVSREVYVKAMELVHSCL